MQATPSYDEDSIQSIIGVLVIYFVV